MKSFYTEKIEVKTIESAYSVYIGQNVYKNLPQLLKTEPVNNQIAIISTPPVSDLYLSAVNSALADDWEIIHRDVADGEDSKALRVAEDLYTWLINCNFERKSTILALGGGVIGDLAGYVASTYLRGVNLAHLPTSLLAQVDSSIGGKVGVNHPLGKNLIGSFYQPRFVLTDTAVLTTLNDLEYLCGLGEVVKYAILDHQTLFGLLEKNIPAVLNRGAGLQTQIIQQCIRIKCDIVSQDMYEEGLRSHLNLGHTFGHALETFFAYRNIKHGQAILLGLRCAVTASRLLNMLSESVASRIVSLLDHFPVQIPQDLEEQTINQLYDIMRRDKKVEDGKIHIIGIRDIGVVEKVGVSENILLESFRSLINNK
jgi:3-dehydroquinate synthase